MTSVVITGGTKGIGFGLAQEFRSRGFDVVISGRTQDSVDDALQRLSATPGTGRTTGHVCDVSSAAAVHDLWNAAAADVGRIDYWVNNAGVAHTVRPAADLPADDARAMVTSNLLGGINGATVALQGMKAQGGGKLFMMLGGGADGKVRPGMAVYGATKSGLKFFTDAIIKENKDGPVMVGGVSPGMVVTEGMLREAKDMGPEAFAKQRKVMNILCDHVEDVAPVLVDRMIEADRHGTFIKRMTSFDLAKRFATGGRGRDVFSRYGY
jgi:NAD(P)-dependent dehydrogenase (short-subunit alcohol dehydrogenase family)